MPGRALEPIAIPPWAWSRDETRRLLQERDIPGLLRFAQQFGGATQTQLAASTGLAQGRISEVLHGQKTVTAFDVYERIAEGLNMPDPARMLFGLAPQNLAIITGDGRPGASMAQRSPAPRAEPDGKEDRVRRREFMGLAGAALFESATGQHLNVDDIATALTRYAGSSPAATTHDVSIPALAKGVVAAKSDYQACHYETVARQLPTLLERLDTATSRSEGDDIPRVSTLKAEAYHVAASILLKCDERGLAWLAADRSMHAAQHSENPATIGASARIVTRALMKEHHYGAATTLASSTAQRVANSNAPATPDAISVRGALLLSAAVSAAQREERDDADILLGEAEQAGRELGGDHNYQWTAFGPTNVLLHRVNTAVTLGDAGRAISYARQIQLDNIDVTERKVTLFVDAARAYSQWGKLDKSYEALMSAEHMAPEELTARRDVHHLIHDIGSRSTGHLQGNISELAERAGISR